MNISSIYQAGQRAIVLQKNLEEQEKLGQLRAGSTGLVDDKGVIIGHCAGRSYLRQQGIDVVDEEEGGEEADGAATKKAAHRLLLEGGINNEDIWARNFTAAGVSFLREREIPTSWFTESDIKVTGRPDMVILDAPLPGGRPIKLLELKNISSLWRHRAFYFTQTPSLGYLAQTGHYLWQLSTTYPRLTAELWFTNRAKFAVTGDWPKKLFPRYGAKFSDACEYKFSHNLPNPKDSSRYIAHEITEEEFCQDIQQEKNLAQLADGTWYDIYEASIKSTLPTMNGFSVWWEQGQLFYQSLDSGSAPVATIITLDNMKRYYSFVADLVSYGKVPPPPCNFKANGTKENFKLEDYCDLRKVGLCCKQQVGTPLQVWVDKIRDTFKNP